MCHGPSIVGIGLPFDGSAIWGNSIYIRQNVTQINYIILVLGKSNSNCILLHPYCRKDTYDLFEKLEKPGPKIDAKIVLNIKHHIEAVLCPSGVQKVRENTKYVCVKIL